MTRGAEYTLQSNYQLNLYNYYFYFIG